MGDHVYMNAGDPSGAGTGYEPSDMGPLQEHFTLVTTELSLQPHAGRFTNVQY